MGIAARTFGYVIFLLISILSYFAEIGLNAALAYYLYSAQEITWFALLLCLMIVPSAIIQILSWHQHTQRSRNHDILPYVLVAIVHVLQIGLPWRYVRLLFSNKVPVTNSEIWESFLLRTLHTFFSSLPILYLQGYKIVTSLDDFSVSDSWFLIGSSMASMVSIAWSLATYQRHKDYCCVLGFTPPWLATLSKFVWRTCEIFSRLLTFCLFSLVHGFWVFLVLGFHWITMLLIVIMDRVLQPNENESRIKGITTILLKSYMYIFSHLNLTSNRSKYGFIFFYVISSLESIALLTLWIMYEKRTQYHIPFAVAVAGGYAVALIFALIYYNCFHSLNSKNEQEEIDNKSCLHERADRPLDRFGNNKNKTSSKPWLEIAGNPNPQFFDVLQSSDCNSDRSSDLVEENSLKRSQLMRLDPRTLHHGKSAPRGAYNGALEWDDYDFQVRETPEGASVQESQHRESPRSSINSRDPHSRQASSDNVKEVSFDSPNKILDQGYFSGISASSKDTKKRALSLKNGDDQQILPHKLSDTNELQLKPSSSHNIEAVHKSKYHKNHHHHRQYSGGILSDATTSSTFSTTSSKRPILNCERCGHFVSIDSASLYSVTSTSAASAGSSSFGRLPENNGSLDRAAAMKTQLSKQSANRKCPHHSERQLPIQLAQRSVYGASNSRGISHATSSSGWDCTDSQV